MTRTPPQIVIDEAEEQREEVRGSRRNSCTSSRHRSIKSGPKESQNMPVLFDVFDFIVAFMWLRRRERKEEATRLWNTRSMLEFKEAIGTRLKRKDEQDKAPTRLSREIWRWRWKDSRYCRSWMHLRLDLYNIWDARDEQKKALSGLGGTL